MDLRVFVGETIKQIAAGIKDAQESDCGAIVAPKVEDPKTLRLSAIAGPSCAQTVEFDVAVTVSESASGEGEIKILWFSMGAKVDGGSESSLATRLRFNVPVVWPLAKG